MELDNFFFKFIDSFILFHGFCCFRTVFFCSICSDFLNCETWILQAQRLRILDTYEHPQRALVGTIEATIKSVAEAEEELEREPHIELPRFHDDYSRRKWAIFAASHSPPSFSNTFLFADGLMNRSPSTRRMSTNALLPWAQPLLRWDEAYI